MKFEIRSGPNSLLRFFQVCPFILTSSALKSINHELLDHNTQDPDTHAKHALAKINICRILYCSLNFLYKTPISLLSLFHKIHNFQILKKIEILKYKH